MRALVLDNHPLVTRGLENILLESPRIETVDSASSVGEAFLKLREFYYDIVILEIALRGVNGLDVLKQIQNDHSEANILVLSVYPEDQFAVRSLKAGARGYLSKQVAPQILIDAVHKVASGEFFVTDQVTRALTESMSATLAQPPHQLISDREFQILQLLASGRTVTGIASDLSLSVKTISTYRVRLLQKMGLKTNADVTRYAFEHGLVA